MDTAEQLYETARRYLPGAVTASARVNREIGHPFYVLPSLRASTEGGRDEIRRITTRRIRATASSNLIRAEEIRRRETCSARRAFIFRWRINDHLTQCWLAL